VCFSVCVCLLAVQLCNNFRFDKGPWRQVESFQWQRGVASPACLQNWKGGTRIAFLLL